MSEMCEILISVKPRFLDGFLDGSKKIELRTRLMNVEPGTRTWIYGKAPYAKVAAACVISSIEIGSPARMWETFGSISGLSREEFRDYFAGYSTAYVIVFGKVTKLKRPIGLSELRQKLGSFHPPQFFKKLAAGSAELKLLAKAIT